MNRVQPLSDIRITRQLEPRLEAVRAAAHGAVDDLDDRARLFHLELRAETSRLTRLAVYAVAGVVCALAPGLDCGRTSRLRSMLGMAGRSQRPIRLFAGGG